MDDLLTFEISQFKNGIKDKIDFNNKLNENVFYRCLKLALFDALGQYCRREKKKYKDQIEKGINDKERGFVNFKNKILEFVENCNLVFNKNFYIGLVEEMNKVLTNLLDYWKDNLDANYGILQKIVSMTLKYVYCFNIAEKGKKFKNCYMPLDQYTLQWFKSYEKVTAKNKNTNYGECIQGLRKINYAWSKINKDLFYKIQESISAILDPQSKYKYKLHFNKDNGIALPESGLEAEFVIWRYEQLKKAFNDVMGIQKKNKDYFSITINYKYYYFSSLYL